VIVPVTVRVHFGAVTAPDPAPIAYEPLPTTIYRARARSYLPSVLIGLFIGLGGVAFGASGLAFATTGEAKLFAAGFLCFGTVFCLGLATVLVRLHRTGVGLTPNGVALRAFLKTRHIPYSALRDCKRAEVGDEATVVLIDRDWNTIPLEVFAHRPDADKDAFVAAVRRAIATIGAR